MVVPIREKTEATRSAVSMAWIWLGVKPSGSMLTDEIYQRLEPRMKNELDVSAGLWIVFISSIIYH